MEDKKKLKSRINWLCEQKVNAFSPTISPAPKNTKQQELESIESAIRYYLDRGVNSFILQPKYMGSYCDIYLHHDLRKSYFVSRNGYVIHHINIEEAFTALESLHARFDWNTWSMVILQSELLPWYALGGGLIENEYLGYLQAHQTHYNYLQSSELYSRLQQVKDSAAYQAFQFDKQQLKSAQWKAKYPSHVVRQYQAIEAFSVLDLPIYKEGINVYTEQVQHYGQRTSIHFKPFNILKKIGHDGQEEIPNSNTTFFEVNEDAYKLLTIDSSHDLRMQLEDSYHWFQSLSDTMEEGIMIKPTTSFIKGLPPAFKVRNNRYLTMIYGIDFMQRYEHHLEKRNISKKVECSINDWMINWELLKTPYQEIDNENYYYKNLLLDRILGEQIENNLDHRL